MTSEVTKIKKTKSFHSKGGEVRKPPRADAPEAHNSEQADEEAQAQSVAEDALADQRARVPGGLSDTIKPTNGGDDDDVQDVIDHMTQMDRSGQIDMDAFRGERSDDDEEGALGPSGVERSAPRGAE